MTVAIAALLASAVLAVAWLIHRDEQRIEQLIRELHERDHPHRRRDDLPHVAMLPGRRVPLFDQEVDEP